MFDGDILFSTTGQLHKPAQYIRPLLDKMSEQAVAADESRSLSSELVSQIKGNDIMQLSASPELGGLDETMLNIANELRDVATRCTSTAWCLWNHLCTFHHFAGLLGPQNSDMLRELVSKREWVCFPAGATSEVTAAAENKQVILNGVAAFGSGCRYADWAGVIFDETKSDRATPQFALADLRSSNVRIEQTWEAMSLRASATDHIHYEGLAIDSSRIVPWPLRVREEHRIANTPMIHHRYREDWVAISVMWLGAMATGVAEISLTETAKSIQERIAIFGTKMADKPTIHVNLGRARALINGATDTVYSALAETDARIASKVMPCEGDYFRQTSAGMQAVTMCEEAMRLVLRVLGGNGLREGTDFERRYRDFQAMPLHINGHVDRITEQLGRITLGLNSQNPF
jgi:3-hydroxy-9,10-secoandrosta-1,3,5(10)-triene-9,17-dione monooxygenase